MEGLIFKLARERTRIPGYRRFCLVKRKIFIFRLNVVFWDTCILWMTSMGYMYPMDDIHRIQVSHGTPCHTKRNVRETMSRLFAIVGCAPLGSYYSPLVLKPHSRRVGTMGCFGKI